MSMECDTRLSMMALKDNGQHNAAPRRHTRVRRFRTTTAASATAVASMATFALTLFTRGA